MSNLEDYRERARAARRRRAELEEARQERQSLLRLRQAQLARFERSGQAGTQAESDLLAEIADLETRLRREVEAASAQRSQLAQPLVDAAPLAPPWEQVEALSDSLPFLLLPVRLETRFMPAAAGTELWVRIFPDNIAVHTDEKTLTQDEVDAGKDYWREIWRAWQGDHADKRQAIEKGAWRALAEAYGGPRAAWIRTRTQPANLDAPRLEDLQFPAFPEGSLKAESWSQAPRTNVMPDRFVVMGFSSEKEVFRQAGNPVPDPLIVGPDPQALEIDFRQQNGELLVGEEIAWIYDFEQAAAVGMGIKIPLEPPFDTEGLAKLVVLGLRLSEDENETQKRVEELFENHRYAPDGLSLAPQGTPTNNTTLQGSGFSSQDPGGETSFAVETGAPLFEPTNTALAKRDGQRLVEALGIGPDVIQHIQNADGLDARHALLMNRALWYATLGYYVDEMLHLSQKRMDQVHTFFTEFVSGRGPLPAIRVGTQPYGILLSSDFSRWKWSREADGPESPDLDDLHTEMSKLEKVLRSLIPGVARIGAAGDPFDNLLKTLGLHPTSVEFYRRHAVGLEYLWNYEAFLPGNFQGRSLMELLEDAGRKVADDLEIGASRLPGIFNLSYFTRHDLIQGPLVDDIPADEVEKLSETRRLPRLYQIPDPQNPEATIETDYIGWLGFSPYKVLKAQRLENAAGEALPAPRPLLYRLLRAALLEAVHDAVMRLYTRTKLLRFEARREVELSNIQFERTVTRWEFMDVDISEVMPNISNKSESIAEFVLSEEGQERPEAKDLRDVLRALRALSSLSTAQLERVFAEHIDLCSYRLDAWQTGCFNRRLQQQRYPPSSAGEFEKRVQGLYLGAFGWLEDLRPAPPATPADLAAIPATLHDPQRDGPLFEQPDNAGFIHAPSLNHAVTAAVLRSAYLTHFDPQHPEKMAVDLSSERVRTALAFLEGVRNGQDLGALLGYQFERGLHDRYGDPSLSQFIPNFRQRFPLVADKITADPGGEQIETKEARNVFDGYALLEVAVLRAPPADYPYGVADLPPVSSKKSKAILAEVRRMAESLDAIADLSLAEGVYQVTQGNYDRAGAMLKAMTQGESPAEPEIVHTLRSGTAVSQRVALHLPAGAAASRWTGTLTKRAALEPGLNAWLGDLLPRPGKIQYTVFLNDKPVPVQNLTGLGLQPIDLVYLIGDDLLGETTELEARIIYNNRRNQKNDALDVRIDFQAQPADPLAVTLFELLPLLRALRRIVSTSRPLGAGDYTLPSEATSDPAVEPNPQHTVLAELKTRVQTALIAFNAAVTALAAAIPAAGADGQPNPNLANAERLRSALRVLADYGLPDAFPHSAFGATPQAKTVLTSQAAAIHAAAVRSLAAAQASKAAADGVSAPAEERTARYRSAAQAIFGPAFNLLPTFTFAEPGELRAAANFRDALPPNNLTRHHADNPLLVEEWLQGAARVQPKLDALETITIFGEAFGAPRTQLKPIQLPFRKTDHWLAVEYPETYQPEGEFLSILQVLPATGFQPDEAQKGLLLDEWTEVIPNRAETTGIAFHFNQPNTEPPQTLLLAVTPEVTGAWTWDKLVGTLLDTFQRARMRAVEPEQIGDSIYGHLLPAILTPVASRPFATISTDLVHQTAQAVQDPNE